MRRSIKITVISLILMILLTLMAMVVYGSPEKEPSTLLYEIAILNEDVVENIIYDLPTPERQALLTTAGNVACDVAYVGNTFQEKYAKSRLIACRTLERLWYYDCYSACER